VGRSGRPWPARVRGQPGDSFIWQATTVIAVRAGGLAGDQLATMLKERAASLGFEVQVEVQVWTPGNYGVSVDWPGNPNGLRFEVADGLDGVRVLDPDGEDLTTQQALDYFSARLAGHTPKAAMALISGPSRDPWWRRLRRRED